MNEYKKKYMNHVRKPLKMYVETTRIGSLKIT